MAVSQYEFTGKRPLRLKEMSTDGKADGVHKADKPAILAKTRENLAKIAQWQEKLYADGREGVVFVLQAMDAAGKDSTIKHAMASLNPQGVDVVSFKQPSQEELAHDYLWRAARALPPRGKIAIFNRSHYEDVLVVQVHELQNTYRIAKRCLHDGHFFEKRYEQIRNCEEYLYENSYRVVKIFLNVSKKEQKKRFLERIDDEAKNWKFSAGDLKEREHWDEYQKLYEKAINATATPHSPWFVLPADRKWYTRYLVSEVVLQTLEACAPEYPELPEKDKANLAACKAALLAE